MGKTLAVIEFPQFLRHVKLADKAAKKYYKKGEKIPKKYEGFRFCKKTNRLIHPDGSPVIKNINNYGKPRFKKINGQHIYSGSMHPMMRSKIVNAIKEDFKQHLSGVNPVDDYPVNLSLELYTTIENGAWDLDNLWIYTKCIQDLLVTDKILPEDNISIITESPGIKLIPVETDDERKLVLSIFKEDRDVILNHPYYAKLHGENKEW